MLTPKNGATVTYLNHPLLHRNIILISVYVWLSVYRLGKMNGQTNPATELGLYGLVYLTSITVLNFDNEKHQYRFLRLMCYFVEKVG